MRQAQADFKITLINSLKKKEVTDSIKQLIIQTIKLNQLGAEVEQLKFGLS